MCTEETQVTCLCSRGFPGTEFQRTHHTRELGKIQSEDKVSMLCIRLNNLGC